MSRDYTGPGFSAAATALVSPISFIFLADMRHDSPHLMPARLAMFLVRYGEGPHIFISFAVPVAIRRWGSHFSDFGEAETDPLILAAIFSALVALTVNFYGATALAIFYPILAWSLWVTESGTAFLVRVHRNSGTRVCRWHRSG